MITNKVKELLVEAGFEFWADEPWGPGPGNISWDSNYDKEMEKFIELLVAATISIYTEKLIKEFDDKIDSNYGYSRVSGDASVYGNAKVMGNAEVSGNAGVNGDAQVSGTLMVSGDTEISD